MKDNPKLASVKMTAEKRMAEEFFFFSWVEKRGEILGNCEKGINLEHFLRRTLSGKWWRRGKKGRKEGGATWGKSRPNWGRRKEEEELQREEGKHMEMMEASNHRGKPFYPPLSLLSCNHIHDLKSHSPL